MPKDEKKKTETVQEKDEEKKTETKTRLKPEQKIKRKTKEAWLFWQLPGNAQHNIGKRIFRSGDKSLVAVDSSGEPVDEPFKIAFKKGILIKGDK